MINTHRMRCLVFCSLLGAASLAAEEGPVPPAQKNKVTEKAKPAVRDEKGNSAQPEATADTDAQQLPDANARLVAARPAYFSFALGLGFQKVDSEGIAVTKRFATDNILRPNEAIYKGSGVTLNETAPASQLVPLLRVEWEIPFEKLGLVKRSSLFTMLFSVEGAFSPEKQLFNSSGDFRYQNAQAPHVALTDLTYKGSLTITERHWSLTPMVGVGIDYSNTTLQKASDLHLLARASLGFAFMSGQRQYDLALTPQAVNAGAYSDTYVIQSQITQSYGMGFLPAGRAELGVRMRLSGRLHLALLFSATVLYGYLPYDNQGFFADRAGTTAERNIYQKIVSGTANQDYLAVNPAVFLALSSEL